MRLSERLVDGRASRADLRAAAIRMRYSPATFQQQATNAAAWASAFPDGHLRDNALEMVARQWAQTDPTGAATWLTELPSGHARDSAVNSFVNTMSPQYPELAAQWVTAIDDQQMRVNQMENVARNWVNFDQTAARAWIAQSPLPAERKNQLLNRAQ